jgi:hypothetical protein
MSVMRLLALWLALVPLAAAQQQPQRGMPEDIGGVPEEKEFKEDALKLPPPPEEAALLPFQPRGYSRNRFYIDGKSLLLGEDRVVRYTVVVVSPSGVRNVSYEGMRCKTSEYKVYAYGAQDGKWANVKDARWQDVGRTQSSFRFGLWVDYFCASEAVAGRNVEDLVLNLQGKAPYRSNTTKN